MTTSTFDIENKAEERGRTSTALNHLTTEIASVRIDVRRLTWIAVPLVCVALVLSIVALVVALQLAYLLFVSRAATYAAPPPVTQPLVILDWRLGSPFEEF